MPQVRGDGTRVGQPGRDPLSAHGEFPQLGTYVFLMHTQHPEQTIYLPLILGPRSVAERFVARLDARPEYRGWWMGWVPRVDDDTA
jgi:hypothetical protein